MLLENNGMRIIFPLKFLSGTFDTDFFIPSLVDNRISLIEVNSVIGKIHEETNFMSGVRMLTKKAVIGFLFLTVLMVINMITMTSGSGSSSLNFFFWIMPVSGVAFTIYMIYNFNNARKENIVTYKIIVDIITRNQAPFQNVGLRWVVPQHIRWLELWMDYRLNQGANSYQNPINQQNYGANPYQNPMTNQFSGHQNYGVAPSYPINSNSNPIMMNEYPINNN